MHKIVSLDFILLYVALKEKVDVFLYLNLVISFHYIERECHT